MENNPAGMPVVTKFAPPVLLRKTNGGGYPPNGLYSLPLPTGRQASSDILPSSFSFTFIHAYARSLLRRQDNIHALRKPPDIKRAPV
jgi:hypothetical protein